MRGIVFASTTALGVIFASAAFADSNTVYLYQSGETQKADIKQSNNNNSVGTSTSAFVQENGTGYGYNNLKVDQWAGGNTIGLYGLSKQSGTGNNVSISQLGGGNVELLQIGSYNGTGSLINSYGAAGDILQSGSNAKMSVIQNGSYNGFNIWQGGNYSNLNLTQAGDNQKAVVRQAFGGTDYSVLNNNNPATYGKAYPSDHASSGTITINQGLGGGGSQGFVYAVQGGGDWNSMSLGQDGMSQTASVWQDGASNSVTSYQTGYNNSLGKVGPGTNAPSTRSAPISSCSTPRLARTTR